MVLLRGAILPPGYRAGARLSRLVGAAAAVGHIPLAGSCSRRTALLSRPDGSGEPSYLSTFPAGGIITDMEPAPIQLAFDCGTLVVGGATPDVLETLPGCRLDP